MNSTCRPTLSWLWNRAGWRNPQTGATLVFILSMILKILFHRKILSCYQFVFGSYVSCDFSENFVWIKRKTYWQNSKRGDLCVCESRSPRSLIWAESVGQPSWVTHMVNKEQKSMETLWGAPGELKEWCKMYRNRLFFCQSSKVAWKSIFHIHPLHPLWVQQDNGGWALKQEQLIICLFSSVSSEAKNIALHLFYSPFNATLQRKRIKNLAVPIRNLWIKITL